jgi:hypothetical protein
MSERPPEYHDGRPAAPSRQAYSTTSVRLPVDDLDAWRAVKWREAVAAAVGRLAADGAFAPGDTLRLEQVALPNVVAEGWLQVTARVEVEREGETPPVAAPLSGAPPTRPKPETSHTEVREGW